MTLEEIKAAVLAGNLVHWANSLYEVRYAPKIDKFQIVCVDNTYWDHSIIGLTHKDGVTLNGKEDEFYISGKAHSSSSS